MIGRLRSAIRQHAVFFKNMFWQYLTEIAKYVLPFITFPYLTRVLRPESYAIYAYVLAFMGLAQVIVDYGFRLSGTTAVSRVREDKSAVSKIVGQITYARLIISLVVGCGIALIAPFIELLRENALFTFLSFLVVVLQALLPDYVFQSYEKMRTLTTRYLITKSLSVVGILLLIHNPDDLMLIAAINIVCAALGYGWTLKAMRRELSVATDWSALDGIWDQIKTSSLYCFSNISSALFNGFTTVVIGLVLTDKSELAYWSLGITAIGCVQSLYGPIANSLYPHMINGRDLKFAYRLGIAAAPVLAVGTTLFMVLADFIVAVLGGQGYEPAAKVLVWLSPILPVSFYGIYIGWPILGAIGEVRKLTLSTVISGVTNVALMSAAAVTGVASLSVICSIRVFIELLMLVLRGTFLAAVLRNGKVRSA